jgi:hypothetical protein
VVFRQRIVACDRTKPAWGLTRRAPRGAPLQPVRRVRVGVRPPLQPPGQLHRRAQPPPLRGAFVQRGAVAARALRPLVSSTTPASLLGSCIAGRNHRPFVALLFSAALSLLALRPLVRFCRHRGRENR